MAQRHIYLHCGAFKTGTSAQQAWLVENAALVSAAGLAHPHALAGTGGSSHDLAQALMRPPEARSLADWEVIATYASYFEAHAEDDFLLSSEALSGPFSVAGLAHVGAALAETGRQVISALFIRNQVDQISSHYAQRAKSLRMLEDFSTVSGGPSVEIADWAAQRTRHLALGFDLRLGVYGDPGKPVVAELLRVFGLRDRFPTDCDLAMKPMNTSIGEIGVLAGLTLARAFHSAGAKLTPRLQDAARRFVVEGARQIADQPFIGPTPDDREVIRARFAASNAALRGVLSDAEIDVLLTERLPVDRPASPRSLRELSPTQREACESVILHVQKRLADSPEHASRLPATLLSKRITAP